jgi:LysM repeat protein|tara:strand:- start:179 stop:2992 length:2814 start_codon:yes stop_codon:yes gene_type:complete
MVLQVGTTNFQSTAGESFRRPVNTFVEPVTVLPKTGMMDLAQALSTVNPVLQKYLGNVIEEEKQKGIQAGQLEVLQSSPAQINKLKKELEEREGKRFARNFVGNNIYMQYGIEKQLAINLGNASEAKTKKFFSEYVVDVELPDGTIVKQPLSQFDINSKEFQNAVNQFQETSLVNTRGIRPELVTEYVLPKQNLALAKVFNTQETNLAEAKIEQANLLFNTSVLNSWFSIDNFNDSIELNLIDDNYTEKDRANNNNLSHAEFLALQELQLNVDSMVDRGLQASVSPASMLTLIKTNALQILDYYETNNLDMDMAQEEVEDYMDWIGNLKLTNGMLLKDFYIQGGEDKRETIINEIFEKKNEVIKNQNTYNKLEEEKTINNTLDSLDFSRTDFTDAADAINYYKKIGNTLDSLATEYPDRIEFLYKQYDLKNFSVDNFFFDLERIYDQGEISQADALVRLTDVMMALGPNASKADRDKYEKLKKYIKETEGKSLETRFPEVANLKKYGMKRIGKTNDYGVSYIGDQPTVDKMEDLNLELDRLVKKHGGLSVVFTTDDGQKMTIKNWYLGELRKIANPKAFGTYEFYDDAYNFKEPVPIEEEVTNDGSGNNTVNNNDVTVNLDQQKILIYDKETKLFNEVNASDIPQGSTIVSINGLLTPDGSTLKDELNIDSFENFNYKLYNQNFENKQTIEKNEKLLKDDLEAGTFSEGGFTTFEIESGDTLSAISEDFGIPIEAIMKANGITNANQIDIGDVLLIPEGVDYTDLNNINFIENLDKTKLITELEHPYAPVRRKHNFQVIYNLAKKAGIKFPELVAAQAMHESSHGDNRSSENNFLGLKATSSEVAKGESELKDTTEDYGKGLVSEKADFKKFENLEEMIRQYKIQWNDDFLGRKGTVNANTVLEALELIKAGDYATDKDYVTKVMNLLNGAKAQGWY